MRPNGRPIARDEPTVQFVREHLGRGKSYAQIGELLGVTKNVIAGIVQRNGLCRTKRGPRTGSAQPKTKGWDSPAAGECRYIAGDPKVDPTVCGKPVGLHKDGRTSSFCQEHHDRCWISATSKKGRQALKNLDYSAKRATHGASL